MTDFESTFENNGGAFDAPSDQDYIATHILGAVTAPDMPSEVNLNSLDHTHSQGKSMHCTAYGITHAKEIQETLQYHISALCDPEEQWANQVYSQGQAYAAAMEKEGTSLQVALQALLKYGLNNKTTAIKVDKFRIVGYSKIENTLADIKKWLALGFAIYTGSGAHCYCLCGYDDATSELIALNSYGRSASRPRGEFRIPYSKIDTLFSKYILHDAQDIMMIFQDVSEKSPMAEAIKYCRDKKIMVGYGTDSDPLQRLFQPEKPVTRAEMAQIIFNMKL